MKKFWENIYLENTSDVYDKVTDEHLIGFTERSKKTQIEYFTF